MCARIFRFFSGSYARAELDCKLQLERGTPLLVFPPRLAFEAALGARPPPEVFMSSKSILCLIFPFRWSAAAEEYSRELYGKLTFELCS